MIGACVILAQAFFIFAMAVLCVDAFHHDILLGLVVSGVSLALVILIVSALRD